MAVRLDEWERVWEEARRRGVEYICQHPELWPPVYQCLRKLLVEISEKLDKVLDALSAVIENQRTIMENQTAISRQISDVEARIGVRLDSLEGSLAEVSTKIDTVSDQISSLQALIGALKGRWEVT